MYKSDDDLCDDSPLFSRRSSSIHISHATRGRLALGPKARENQIILKAVVTGQNKRKTSSSLNEDLLSEINYLQSSFGKSDRKLFSCDVETGRHSLSIAPNETRKGKVKIHPKNNLASNLSLPQRVAEKSNFVDTDFLSFSQSNHTTVKGNMKIIKRNNNAPKSRLSFLAMSTGLTNCDPSSDNIQVINTTENPKGRLIPTKVESNTSRKTDMLSSSKMHTEDTRRKKRKTILSEDDNSQQSHLLHPRICGQGNVNLKHKLQQSDVGVSTKPSLSPTYFKKEKHQLLSPSQNLNFSTDFDFESFDQVETCLLNISDDIFLPLEVNEENTDEIDQSGAKLCDDIPMEVLAPKSGVNPMVENENNVTGFSNCVMLDDVDWTELPASNSETLSKCVRIEPQVQKPMTASLTGTFHAAMMQASVAAKKNDNKKAWEGMMALMRSSAGTKRPVKSVVTTVEPPVRTIPVGGASKGSNGSKGSTTNSTGSSWKSNGNRPCPFYKKIPGTGFAVDAFNYGCIPGVSSYFLSHFHSDHYIGLKASFSLPIYCTSITASLVQLNICVKSQFLHILPLHHAQDIEGVRVTALDANHCPGSVMFLFQLRNGTNILHVGDFRASPTMERYTELHGLRVKQLYLDTTYCDAKYQFPTQEDAVAHAVGLVRSHRDRHPRTLVVCGTYLIGKEKLFMGVAEALDCRIWALAPKRKILRLLEDPVLSARLVDDPMAADVHVISMRDLRMDSLGHHQARYCKQFSHVLALKPSGWEFSRGAAPVTRGNVTLAGVAYSEHSSFSELARFVKLIRPEAVIPTVNVGSAQSRQAMQAHFTSWLSSSSLQ